MPDGLHKCAILGDCKKVAELIAAGVDVNGVNAYGRSPLYSVLGTSGEPTIDEYRAIILLLEAGANPLQSQPGDELWKVGYPLFAALEKDHLAQVLLLLWYVKGDYKTIKMMSAEGDEFNPTLQRYIEMTGKNEAKEGKHRDYVRWINETAADAKQVRELFIEAERYLEIISKTAENREKAARFYSQAAKIYQKHEELEDRRVYFQPSFRYGNSATPKQLHELLKDYYRQKRLSCLKKEFECYQIVERELTDVDEESVKHHLEIINRLIDLSKLLEKETDLRFYLGQAAEVMMRLPDRRVSEATTISDDEVAVDLEENAEGNSERVSLLENKPAATSSFFGALSSLRRRHVLAAAPQTGQGSQVSILKA